MFCEATPDGSPDGSLISFSPSDNDPLGNMGLSGAMGEGRGCCAENGTANAIASAVMQRITDETRTREAFQHFIHFPSKIEINHCGGMPHNILSQVMMEGLTQSREAAKKKR
jgi:hypothetical protein